jgi:antitoxin PrlF
MAYKVTVKGQVTIPKRVRDALGLKPGERVAFEVDERGQVVVKRAGQATAESGEPDAFDRFVGSSDYKFGGTAAAMKFLRGKDYEIEMDIDPPSNTPDAPG